VTTRSSPLFWGLVVLGASIVAAGAIGAAAARSIKRANDVVTVTGSARRPIRSDFAIWRGSVASQQPALADAYREVTRYATRVRAYLADQGVPDSAVTFRPLETYGIPEISPSGRETGRTAGYRLSQSFEVRFADVDRATQLSQQAASLVDQGVPFTSSPPEYIYTRLADIRIGMLGEATKDARARAAAITGSMGSEVGAVRSATVGVFQITPRYSTEVSDYGINDVSSVEKDITAVVRVTFAIEE
jgi:hypothetical protein